MGDDLGYAMVGDLGRCPISRIYLRDGLVWMIADSQVPHFDGGSCMVRFYSPDGAVVGIIADLPIPPWDLGPFPGTAYIEFTVSLESRRPNEPYMDVIR